MFQRFTHLTEPNASNAARHRIIDDLLRERLRALPDLPVVPLGAGFLLCDLIDARFVRRYGQALRKIIRELGGDFADPLDDPAAVVASLGYRQLAAYSVMARAVEHGISRMPRWLLNTLMRSVRDGYRIVAFQALPLPDAAAPAVKAK